MPFTKGNKLGGRKPNITKQAQAEAYTKALAAFVEQEAQPIIEALVNKAKSGDVPAIKEIHERLLGKVKDEMSLTGNINHSFDDISEDILKTIIQREASRIKVSG